MGVDNGIMREPAVIYYVMGDTSDPKAPGNQWRQAADWPVPSTATNYYFGADGTLVVGNPACVGRGGRVPLDPEDPLSHDRGGNLSIPSGPQEPEPDRVAQGRGAVYVRPRSPSRSK